MFPVEENLILKSDEGRPISAPPPPEDPHERLSPLEELTDLSLKVKFMFPSGSGRAASRISSGVTPPPFAYFYGSAPFLSLDALARMPVQCSSTGNRRM